MYLEIYFVVFFWNIGYHFCCGISSEISMLLLIFLETKKLHQSESIIFEFSTFTDILVSSSVSTKSTFFCSSGIFINFHLSFPFLCLFTATAQLSLSLIRG